MHIDYTGSNGVQYATVCTTVRRGDTITKERIRYLGRVIDKEKGIYKNKEYGFYQYSLESDTVNPLPPESDIPNIVRKNAPEIRKCIGLSFGDAFIVSEIIKRGGLQNVIEETDYPRMDTLKSTILFHCISDNPISRAKEWWDMSYAKLMYPQAEMELQSLINALAEIGSEIYKRNFFECYFEFLKSDAAKSTKLIKKALENSILIDDCNLPYSTSTKTEGNSAGNSSEQDKLLYVVQQGTGFPLFYQYVPAGKSDVSSIIATIKMLQANGVNTKWALLNEELCTGSNADALYAEDIPFLSRVTPSRKMSRDAVQKSLKMIRRKENEFVHEGKLYYIFKIDCVVGEIEDHRVYGYLCLDEGRYQTALKQGVVKAEYAGVLGTDALQQLENNGLFMLISSQKLKKEDVLALYFTRNQVSETIEASKKTADDQFLANQSETVHRGYLLLSFLSEVTRHLLVFALSDSEYTPEDVIRIAHDLQCLEYPGKVLINKVPKPIAKLFKAVELKIPETLSNIQQ